MVYDISLVSSLAVNYFLHVLCVNDQLQAICNDETAVEQAKKQGSHRLNISKKALLAEVFGKGKALSLLFVFH